MPACVCDIIRTCVVNRVTHGKGYIMKFILDFIKGMFIGVANVIPGVSGGTMAVSMGIYDKLVTSINNITKKFKKSFIALLPIILGMGVGIAVFSFIIPYCLEVFAFQTCMCFAGLILGGIPELVGETKKAFKKEQKGINAVHIIVFIVFMALAVWMAVANPSSVGATDIKVTFPMIIMIFAFGVICSAAMVVPGISGSLLLMMLGYYSAIMGTISSFIVALKNFNGSAIGHGLAIIVPFGIGCILGILLISKLITWLLEKFESITYFGILGLVLASPFAIFYKMNSSSFSPVVIIVGIVLFLVGAVFTYWFGEKTKSVDAV